MTRGKSPLQADFFSLKLQTKLAIIKLLAPPNQKSWLRPRLGPLLVSIYLNDFLDAVDNNLRKNCR